MELSKKAPRRKDDRVILHFDYDCFYAQVMEAANPALKSQPLGIQQKNILATCNYNARRQGVRKLMLVSEAQRLCPELVLVDGEDLTPFRNTSKTLFRFLQSYSWNHKVERLGFDEVFMDVTDMVDYNLSCLNPASLSDSFFCLSKQDPELGFACDFTRVAGCVEDDSHQNLDVHNVSCLRLVIASYLARYLRLKIEEDFGYTSACGISTNKLLSKLVGTKNKPQNQTTLLALSDDAVAMFIGDYRLKLVPGLGSKITHQLETYIASQRTDVLEADEADSTVKDVRDHPQIGLATLDRILGGPGTERGLSGKIWALLHGVDPTEVKLASDIPSQISIEDTYKGVKTIDHIIEELNKLSQSLIRRMRTDLLIVESDDHMEIPRWIARPKTIRLAVRWWPADRDQARDFHRVSRSGALPSFVFAVNDDIRIMADRLVTETVLPLLRRLEGPQWNLQLINICVANMAPGAGDERSGAGRDIGAMFKRQDEVLRPWKVTVVSDDEEAKTLIEEASDEEFESSDAWNDSEGWSCPDCGNSIPTFAVSAHSRYHLMGD